jgi:hypothetical protein
MPFDYLQRSQHAPVMEMRKDTFSKEPLSRSASWLLRQGGRHYHSEVPDDQRIGGCNDIVYRLL